MTITSDAAVVETDLDTVDLTDPRLYAEGDPHPVWTFMRAHRPVHWQPVGATGFWSVTRYEDAEWVLKDHHIFTSQRGTLLNLLGTDDPAGGRQMAVTDPPRHTRMRVPLQRALNPKVVEAYAGRIRTATRALLAPAAEGRPFDFAAAMMTLPMAVTGTIMALPPEDWPHLTRLTTMSIAPDDEAFQLPGGSRATLERAHRELFAYFQEAVGRRQHELGDDLLSYLLGLELDGRRLQPGEVVSNCYSLLLGANVTTPHVPNAALDHLMRTGGYAAWAARPDLFASGVEEALRWASPANHFMRYTVCEVVVRGVAIPAGTAVVAWLGSANRDEEVFPDPFRFDLARQPNRHIAFGVGPHYCVGHAVARLTLRILFEEILANFEDFEPAGEARRLHSNFIAGFKHLPVLAHPRPTASERLSAHAH